MTLQETFEKYRSEIEHDVILDEVNIRDVQMKLASLKHKWVARLIQHKIEVQKFEKMRKEAFAKIADNIRNSSRIGISDNTISRMANKHEAIRKIDDEIKSQNILVDYLERVEKIFHSMDYGIKNLLEIIKSETM